MSKNNDSHTISRVEKISIERANRDIIYSPIEKIKTIVVENFPLLGKLAAMRFLEWAQENEGWTIALPTGKTPEHFIKWLNHLLNSWKTPETRKLLEDWTINPAKKPKMNSFHFVQIDEFYPINTFQHNSFYHYVNNFYIKGFGLDPKKALLINPNAIGLKEGETLEDIWPSHQVDLGLRTKKPNNILEEKQKRVLDAVDQFCTDYETKIRELGGIGFFLGGIGPDGHIGFNVRGSDHYSTTRLMPTNYETQAAAASDLGGMEISRNRLVITIGLNTIVSNAKTTAIIIAAGEAKAKIIKDAIQSDIDNNVPASVLQLLPNAAFYITKGAAKLLTERNYLDLISTKKVAEIDKKRIITDLALMQKKKLSSLNAKDFNLTRSSQQVFKEIEPQFKKYIKNLADEYKNNISKSMIIPKNQVYLHTAPHHDDIMLAYLPYLVRLMREPSSVHYFNYLTSGFNAVTNKYMFKILKQTQKYLKTSYFKKLISENYFDPKNTPLRNEDVLHYLDGIAANDEDAKEEASVRRFISNLIEVYEEDSLDQLHNRINELMNYFQTQYPGKKDLRHIQQLKGMTREWEGDVLWGYFGHGGESVIHSRLGFYKGDIFTEEPTIERDIMPILKTIKKIKPSIITVALDPEGSGPDTHYKVLQAVAEALKIYKKETGRTDIKIWGYRNVWFRFHPTEATNFIPVTLNSRAILHDAFYNAFGSQRDASFPSYEYDGPFSGLAQKIQVEQYQELKTLLGSDFFYQNADSRIRSTRGFSFIKEMSLDEFYEESIALRKMTEDKI
jgi:glucosamine-6-phosphate deaminase